jgi:hypothetical protein
MGLFISGVSPLPGLHFCVATFFYHTVTPPGLFHFRPRTLNSKPRTQNPKLRTQNSEPYFSGVSLLPGLDFLCYNIFFTILSPLRDCTISDRGHSTQNPQPRTQNPQAKTLNSEPKTQNPEPSTQNPQPSTLSPQPSTQNSKLKPRANRKIKTTA